MQSNLSSVGIIVFLNILNKNQDLRLLELCRHVIGLLLLWREISRDQIPVKFAFSSYRNLKVLFLHHLNLFYG